MKLRPEQLQAHLERSLAPVYVLSGDEPLQVQEARDQIHARALALGYNERTRLTVETNFSWETLTECAQSLSLFSTQRLIDLRLNAAKPGQRGAKALLGYAENVPADTLLVISAAKLDRSATQSKWYRALEAKGASIAFWPLDAAAMPAWVRRRAQAHGLILSPEAASLLAERVEGNLLAGAQEVDKLKLIHGEGALSREQVMAAVADSSRYDVFTLVDAALAGDVGRTLRIVRGLEEEGTEPTLVIWALAREIRTLTTIATDYEQGLRGSRLWDRHRVWPRRQGLLRSALDRHAPEDSPSRTSDHVGVQAYDHPQKSRARDGCGAWHQMLLHAAHCDRTAKGVEKGRVWDEIQNLAGTLAGVNLVGV